MRAWNEEEEARIAKQQKAEKAAAQVDWDSAIVDLALSATNPTEATATRRAAQHNATPRRAAPRHKAERAQCTAQRDSCHARAHAHPSAAHQLTPRDT